MNSSVKEISSNIKSEIETTTAEIETTTTENETTTTEIETIEQLTDYDISISDWSITKCDYDDRNVLVVEYSFTNNTDTPKSFSSTFSGGAYQNGVELEVSYLLQENEYSEVLTGKTANVKCAYYLTDNSNVEINLRKLFSFTSETVFNETISLTEKI